MILDLHLQVSIDDRIKQRIHPGSIPDSERYVADPDSEHIAVEAMLSKVGQQIGLQLG
jgi:hypothetical protein